MPKTYSPIRDYSKKKKCYAKKRISKKQYLLAPDTPSLIPQIILNYWCPVKVFFKNL